MSDEIPRTRGGEEAAAETAPSLAEQYEPGVDPAHARDSRVAGPAASDGDPGSHADAGDDRGSPVARKAGGRIALIVAGIVGVVAIVLFAVAVPVAPAIAWIGIALEVALLAALAVSAVVLREGRYRRTSILVITIAMMVAAVLFAVLLLTIGIAR